MAWPRNARSAFTKQMQAEDALRRLAVAAFERWLPAVRDAVEPTALTAAGEPLPDGVLGTRGLWDAIMDHLMLHGAGYLYSYEMRQALLALGFTPTDPALGAVPDPLVLAQYPGFDAEEAQRLAVEIVAEALGVPAAVVIDAAADTLVHPYRTEYLSGVRNRMADVPESTFRTLTRELDVAIEKGESIQEMRGRVGRVLGIDEMHVRAQRVARTESAGSMTSAVIDAAKATGVDQLEKTWVASIDSRTRKSHYRADGQRIPVDGKFAVGRAHLKHPGDPSGPPEETVNCRCAVFILRHDEVDPGEAGRQSISKAEREAEVDRRADDGQTRDRDQNSVGRVASATKEETMTTYRAWTADLAEVGVETDDGRMLASDIDFSTREFPLPLMWQKRSEPGHYSSFAVGVIEAADRQGDKIVGSGYLLNTPEADEAAEEIAHGVSRPSVDLGSAEWILTDQNGDEIDIDAWFYGELPEDTRVIETMTKARLLGATLVSIPAFAGVSITLNGEVERGDQEALVASLVAGGDVFTDEFKPRRDLFANPKLAALTPVTYDEDTGRVFGHLAPWGKAHIAVGEEAPRSPSGYRYFHTSHINTDNGPMMVGKLTVDTGHAGLRLAAHAAASHYDHTGTTWAYVCAGEDEHGIWISGVIHPFATADKVHDGLSSPLSGDWREIGWHYELVAGLSVNVPGFPLVAGATKPDGSRLSLVAALAPRQANASRKAKAEAATINVSELAAEVAVKLAEIEDAKRANARKAEAVNIVNLTTARERRREATSLIEAMRSGR